MKIICVGRNYADHIEELKNEIPDNPVLFLKPSSALLTGNKAFYYPEWSNEIHFECEIVIKIGKNGKYIQPDFALGYIQSISVGIDFTARDLQAYQKSKGLPWEIAKSFDFSAVVGNFIPFNHSFEKGIAFHLTKNGEEVQSGNTSLMINKIEKVISYASKFFSLQTGDLIFTGTPKGVGPINIGDKLVGFIENQKLFECDIK